MKKVNNLLSVFLILLSCVISLRFLLFFSYVQFQKTEFRSQLILNQFHELKHITFSEEDLFKNQNGFEWKEGNKELVINTIYYEVISVLKQKDGFSVALIEDKAENELFENYYSVNKELHDEGIDLIKHLISLTYVNSDFDFTIKIGFITLKKMTDRNLLNTKTFIPVGVRPPVHLV